MSEEKIINILKNYSKYTNAKVIDEETKKEYKVSEVIQDLIDLYNKEKSLNKVLKSKTFKDICYNIGETDKRFISKEKLYKAIKELQDELGISEELQDEI